MPIQFSKTVAILISGLAGTGKTTLANMIKEVYLSNEYKARIVSFASGVKAVGNFMGWDGEKDERGRHLLQEIGKLGRAYDKDCWARLAYNSFGDDMLAYDVIISDDYRFPNEGDYVRNNPLYQVFEIRVYAPDRETLKGTDAYNDISETSLPEMHELGSDRYFDFVENFGTLDDLQKIAKDIVEDINFNAKKWG